MKKHRRITGLIISLCTALSVFIAGCVNAFAIGVAPVTANEGKFTVWIVAGLVLVAAAAGMIYFIIHNKKK